MLGKDFRELSQDELERELAALEQRLSSTSEDRRVKNLFQNLRLHQVELEMQNRELRETQGALEEMRDRYTDLYDFSPIGYMTLNQRGVVREINLTGAQMLNRPRDELLDRPFSPRLVPRYGKAFMQHLKRAFSDPVKSTIEVALRAPGAQTIWIMLESVRVRSRGDTVCRTAMIDVSGRRRAEADLRRSERGLRRVTDALPVPVAYVGADMRYRAANAAHQGWFGVQPDELVGRRVDELTDGSVVAVLRPFARRALRGEEVTFQSTVNHRLLGRRTVAVHLIPDQDDTGAVRGYFAVTVDITDQDRRV